MEVIISSRYAHLILLKWYYYHKGNVKQDVDLQKKSAQLISENLVKDIIVYFNINPFSLSSLFL